MTHWLPVPERAHDPLVAAGMLAVGLFFAAVVPEVGVGWWTGTPPFWVHALTCAVACAGQTQRRSRPLLGLLVATGSLASGAVLVGFSGLGVLLVFSDLLYCAVLHGSRRVSWAVTGAVVVLVTGVAAVSLVADGARAALLSLLYLSLLFAVPIMWGAEVRRHRGEARAERERAEQARRMAERDREAAVAAERARMARDLHDVIAGQLSAIALQSEAALSLADADPATTRRVLRSVRENSVASLAEMRTMIGLLRADGAGEPRTAPAGLDQLDPLLESARASGLRVEVTDRRPAERAAAATDLAAYRIVQELLTNAAKHAPGASVRLRLEHSDDRLVIEVDNDLGPPHSGGGAAGGTGTGLLGLRERAYAVGGRLAAGPHGDGWRVRAELPLDPAAAAGPPVVAGTGGDRR